MSMFRYQAENMPIHPTGILIVQDAGQEDITEDSTIRWDIIRIVLRTRVQDQLILITRMVRLNIIQEMT